MRGLDAGLRRLAMLDAAATVRANRALAHRGAHALFRVASRLGDGILWYALMALVLVAEGPRGLVPIAHMVAVGALGLAIYKWLKMRTARPRPYQVHAAIRLGADPLDAFSFPSGHTLHAVLFTVLAVAHVPELAVILVPFAALVATSRVVLGLHYPSDVLVGAALGALLAAGSLAIFR